MHNYANSFKLTAAVKDLDVASEDINTYTWTCINLASNKDCTT